MFILLPLGPVYARLAAPDAFAGPAPGRLVRWLVSKSLGTHRIAL